MIAADRLRVSDKGFLTCDLREHEVRSLVTDDFCESGGSSGPGEGTVEPSGLSE